MEQPASWGPNGSRIIEPVFAERKGGRDSRRKERGMGTISSSKSTPVLNKASLLYSQKLVWLVILNFL